MLLAVGLNSSASSVSITFWRSSSNVVSILGGSPRVPIATGRWPMRSMNRVTAFHQPEIGSRIGAGVQQHDNRVVGGTDGENLARLAGLLDDEVVGADVDDRVVLSVGHDREGRPALAHLRELEHSRQRDWNQHDAHYRVEGSSRPPSPRR